MSLADHLVSTCGHSLVASVCQNTCYVLHGEVCALLLLMNLGVYRGLRTLTDLLPYMVNG